MQLIFICFVTKSNETVSWTFLFVLTILVLVFVVLHKTRDCSSKWTF